MHTVIARLPFVICLLSAILFAGCASNRLPARPPMPSGIPDLTKSEGPTPAEAEKGDWFLHCGRSRGWAQRGKGNQCHEARQILVTKVPAGSPVRHDLKVGDVILGANGKYFTGHPIYEFRKASLPAQRSEGTFTAILWRKGWSKDREVTLNLAYLPLDFTEGEKPGPAADWNLGPTGARGWMQDKHHESYLSRQILITKVEKGSPADGILQKGDVILGVNGSNFSNDARRTFAGAITRAETVAGGGKLSVRRWRDGQTEDAEIKIGVMGSYSKSAPWNCTKTDKILERACKYLVEKDVLNSKDHRAAERVLAALALMSTGDEAHMRLAKGFVYGLLERVKQSGEYPPTWGHAVWGWGYHNLLLCEYYLITKDKAVLPAIEKFSRHIAEGQSGVGSLGHSAASPNHGRCYGYGAMNQCGTICWITLIMAERCGVTSDEIRKAVVRGKAYLGKCIDAQPVPYGDHLNFDPWAHEDNGKTSAAGCGFSILGDEKGTEFFTRMTVASWNEREIGHTGVWFGLIWGPLAAVRAGQTAGSDFFQRMAWYHDLERRWDGGFTYQGKMGYGYGVDEKTGEQKGGAEHQYGGWDTTACRILMYTLPRKRLVITGKDTLVMPIPDAELASVIDAGDHQGKSARSNFVRYGDRSREQLLELLGSWSPVVRRNAAVAFSMIKGDETKTLCELLKSSNRYARYGACTALRMKKPMGSSAIEPLVKCLKSNDRLLQAHAILALGTIHSEKSLNTLLKKAAEKHPPFLIGLDDYILRVIAIALCESGGMLTESLDGVDRRLLMPAVRRLLLCKDGRARSATARAVLTKLDYDELAALWPTLVPALRTCALTGVGSADGVRETIAQLMAEHKIEEAMPLLLEYMRVQKQHGGGSRRHQMIMDLLVSYGVHAKVLLPEMEKYLAFLKGEHPWSDRSRPGPANFFSDQIPHVEAAIRAVKESTDRPDLRSIEKSLK